MDKSSKHIDEKLLLRFLLGEASKDEFQEIELWLQQSKKNKKLLDSYEAVWAETGKLAPKPVAVDTPSAWGKISEKIDLFEEQKTKHNYKTINFRSKIAWYGASAAAIIVMIIGIYQLIIKPGTSVQSIQIASMEHIVNDTLPDGSRIALNKNSTITYPKEFNKSERRVKLKGEAFINVEHNEKQPFVIETQNAFIEVLGTSFNVKAYENSDIEVIVTDGLVKLYTVDRSSLDTLAILLKAGEKGKVSFEQKEPVYIAEQIPDAIFWMDYTLIFNDTGLKKVFELLENYYKVEIKVSKQQIYDCRLSTTFTNHSIDDIIEVIAETFELQYTKENNIFTFKGDGCAKESL